jgi:catechol 2,3-dioxygenase-like lactoylglutathione lyase family enzyme
VRPVSTPVTVRYIVHDVDAAIGFYTKHLGFQVEMHPAPEFAMVSRGNLRLLLSMPSGRGGGGQRLADGSMPEPGGWNRFQIEVPDLESTVAALRKDGCRFRSEVITGVSGEQILAEDPSGNLVELFQYLKPRESAGTSANPRGRRRASAP